MVCALVTTTFAIQAIVNTHRIAYLRRAGTWFLVSAGAALVTSLYWLIPLFMGRGYEGNLVSSVGQGDLRAYAAVPDATLGLVPNLLGLYGFWAESSGRFSSLKSFAPIWPALLAALLAVCAVGAIVTLRRRSDARAAWVVALLVTGAISLVLEMGYAHPITRGLIQLIDSAFYPYRGMRDAGKWAAMLAFVYSQLFAIGVGAILARLKALRLTPSTIEWSGGFAAAALVALPLYYGNGLLFGAHGEIRPSQYPSGWYMADQVLTSDHDPGTTLFLPWHEYMSYSFVRNEDRVIASPAPTFFSVPVLVSTNPEIPGVDPPNDPGQQAITALVRDGPHGQWATTLAAHGLKYVLVAREPDWTSYGYLNSVSGLVEVGDYGSILLYRNTLVP